MRESVTVTYSGINLCLYGHVYDGQFDHLDRIETAEGLDNLYPLISEIVLCELTEMANESLASAEAERQLYKGSPDDWKFDREAA